MSCHEFIFFREKKLNQSKMLSTDNFVNKSFTELTECLTNISNDCTFECMLLYVMLKCGLHLIYWT